MDTTLIYALTLSGHNSSISADATDCNNIKIWILSNCDVTDEVESICRKASPTMRRRIMYHLENALIYTSFCDESEAIMNVYNVCKRLSLFQS